MLDMQENHLLMATRKCEITVTIPVNSEEQLIINVTCFSENRNMFR